jgi:mannose-1-phosphate guanylyltransferase
LKALILAGGQGLRLRPLTDDRPKPLVEVAGKPIAEWQLDWLIKNVELEQAIFLCGYKWNRLKEHFGNDYKGVRIDYSAEESPLGTGGAFRKAIVNTKLGDENLVMMNGDIALLLVPYKSRFGIVHIDKENFVMSFEEKPEFPDVWINGGIYVASAKRILYYLPEKGDIERETFPKLASAGEVMAYPYRGFWSLIDSIKDIQEVERVLKAGTGGKG